MEIGHQKLPGRIFAVLLLCFATFASVRFALATEISLGGNTTQISLEGHLSHFSDESAALSFDEASQRAFAPLADFRSQGYDRAAHWYRFSLARESDAPERWVLSLGKPYLEDVQVWVVQEGRSLQHFALDLRRQDGAQRSYLDPLAIPIEVSAKAEVYVRVRTTGAVNFSARVWQEEAFLAHKLIDRHYEGMHAGFLLIAVMLYFILGGWLRDAALAFYALLIASQILMIHPELFPPFSAPESWFGEVGPRLGWLGKTIFLALMWDRLLNLRQYFPRIRWLFLLAIGYNLILLPVALFPALVNPAYLVFVPIGNTIRIAISLISLLLVLVLWRRNRSPELLVYFVAFVIPAVETVIGVAANRGWLAETWAVSSLYLTAPLVHVALMSCGLALRLRKMQHDKSVAEQEVVMSAERAQEQRRFVAMLSHEFRNPLAAIDRSAQMLRIKLGVLPEDADQRLSKIRDNVTVLSGFVDNFLMTEALEHGGLALSREACELRPMVEETVFALGGDAGQRIVVRIQPESASFDLDPTLFRVALGNLLGNALRYSPQGAEVEISVMQGEQGLRVVVADQGPGLSEDDLNHLGTPYFRATSSLGKKGSGLGYYFTRRIVEAHGGTLTARPRSPMGLEVLISLPLQPEPAG